MRAVQRVNEEEQPEPKHGNKVAVDGSSDQGGDHVVRRGDCERRDEQADGVLDPEPAEGRPLCPATIGERDCQSGKQAL